MSEMKVGRKLLFPPTHISIFIIWGRIT